MYKRYRRRTYTFISSHARLHASVAALAVYAHNDSRPPRQLTLARPDPDWEPRYAFIHAFEALAHDTKTAT